MRNPTNSGFIDVDPSLLPTPLNEASDYGNAKVYGYADGLDEFILNKEGVFWQKPSLSITTKRQALPHPKIKICAPLIAIAKTNHLEQPDTGLVLQFINQSHQRFTVHIHRRDIKQPKELIAEFYAHDFYLNPEYEQKLILYLSKQNPAVTIDYVSRTGWVRNNNTFVIPSVAAIRRDNDPPLFFYPTERSRLLKGFKQHGHLDDWKTHVAQTCIGNPIPIFAICTAFAGPLLRPLGMDSFCVNIYGKSSGGKTTTLQVAASVWGCGADPARVAEESFLNRWNLTKNALGKLASLANDTLLVLDEVGTYDADDFGNTIYEFLGGSSKGGMKPNQKLREQHHWRIIALSSGEASGRYKIEQKRQAYAGQLTRFVDIPVLENIFKYTGHRSPAEFAEYLKQVCGQYYGTAGPEFLVSLFHHTQDAYELSQKLTTWYERNIHEVYQFVASMMEVSQEKGRTLKRFALIQTAGEIAVNAKVVPFTLADIKSAVQYVIKAWLGEAETMSDGDRMVQTVRNYLIKHQTDFIDLEAKPPILSGKVIGYISNKKKYFLLTDDTFKQACGAFDEKAVAEELLRLGYLRHQKETHHGIQKKRYKIRRKVPTITGDLAMRLYAVCFSILQEASDL